MHLLRNCTPTTVLQYKLQKIFENYLKTKEQVDYTAYISPVHQN